MSETITETRASPVPDDFPVAWERPEDELLFWERDRMHNPLQTKPLEHSWNRIFYEGFNDFVQEFSLPTGGYAVRLINGYEYEAMIPLGDSPEEIAAHEKRADERMMAAVGRVGEAWRRELLPEVLDHLDRWRSFDLDGASIEELVDHLADSCDRLRRVCCIHFLAATPGMVAISELEDLYLAIFGDGDSFGAHRLLHGIGNRTVETGTELWKLSRKARNNAGLRRVFERVEPGRVRRALASTREGRGFLAHLDTYLHTYGERGDLWGIAHPSWIEDPTPVIRNLRSYISRPDDDDPALELKRLASEREHAVARARARIAGRPEDVRRRFEFLLKAAEEGIVVTEDHGFYIDFSTFHQIRRLCLAFGKRFAEAAVLADVDDVFFLFLDELVATAKALPSLDRRSLVAERKAAYDRFARVDEPDALGTPPRGSVPDNSFMRMGSKFAGIPQQRNGDGSVRGTPGAPGSVCGRARVIRSITDADRLEPGDVLVATTTAPPWTPLFAVAAAVVTDTGGVISHCAVVAREYGIPAVVGCGNATEAIADGQTIEVDGNRGVVTVVG